MNKYIQKLQIKELKALSKKSSRSRVSQEISTALREEEANSAVVDNAYTRFGEGMDEKKVGEVENLTLLAQRAAIKAADATTGNAASWGNSYFKKYGEVLHQLGNWSGTISSRSKEFKATKGQVDVNAVATFIGAIAKSIVGSVFDPKVLAESLRGAYEDAKVQTIWSSVSDKSNVSPEIVDFASFKNGGLNYGIAGFTTEKMRTGKVILFVDWTKSLTTVNGWNGQGTINSTTLTGNQCAIKEKLGPDANEYIKNL
ncbi:hypothetical protein ACH4YO_42790 [Streptomyces noursei]|uniref:hypothetical protein n=1 Tax=Streptomyces noursei TaxID=1971 RepID=UPI0033C016D3